ncbi:hypothetical protein PQJ75_29575 [Rhodoplanes sp. TEM]|uniref:Uncharacterized protein n=1 Tax=Rhodoplanes tepidamans TaxID=200616 RepID=A0ABT5JIX9_RHOTP|nr:MULTISPECIES: hypothetical protein [Rhodoplanes]MDC7789691.1 hypothetical protein [Rhodoplanes tepidamans]MDC7987904.1 hypothetical protein [Rhodoplanes sp. TEM]MDQ0359193.1 hypothetical protein [Rhodoplanes tepidamans]
MISVSTLLTPWSVLTATAGLIAFHIGLYTLVGRERKSPYVINAVFPVFLLCLFVATLALGSLLLPPWASDWILQASVAFLTLAFAMSFMVVYRTAVRFVYFVDSIGFKHLPGVRQFRRRKKLNDPKPTFAYSPMSTNADLRKQVICIVQQAIGVQLGDFEKNEVPLDSVALQIAEQRRANEILALLCKAFFEESFCVQYLTASRHPIEFVEYLKGTQPDDNVWRKWAKDLIVIDAYSPHFAFTDSVYKKKDAALAGMAVQIVTSKMTYAGMHSASSEAFNLFETSSGDKVRRPTLVVYEGAYALTDLESAEQYRIFIRHVIPSEKMWGGMLTVFIEGCQNSVDWELLRAYASIAGKVAGSLDGGGSRS